MIILRLYKAAQVLCVTGLLAMAGLIGFALFGPAEEPRATILGAMAVGIIFAGIGYGLELLGTRIAISRHQQTLRQHQKDMREARKAAKRGEPGQPKVRPPRVAP